MTQTEALKLALEALELTARDYREQRHAITAIREALAQPEQEPVAWLCKTHERSELVRFSWETFGQVFPLYTTPPQRKPLTDEEIEEVERWVEFKEEGSGRIPVGKLVRYIEAKLKENT